MNNVTLVGNLCRDPELKVTASGQSVASSAIAVRRDRKEADGTHKTDFFDLVFWGPQAEYANTYLKKGNKIAVAGSVQVREFVTKSGEKGRAIEVIVSRITNLEKKETEEAKVEEVKESQPEISDDDLPF